MKTLKSILLGLALILTINVVKADDTEKLTKDFAVTSYIEAVTHGKLEGFAQVLDNSVKFSMVQGNKVLSFNKNEMLSFMKSNKSEQNCKVTTSTVESDGEIAVIRIDQDYGAFTRSNLVTVTNTGKGWKITSVHSTFK
jgi:hypothetical protein